MATIERLIVQIFDRKRQVIDQLYQQKLLYDQHLASKLLIQGISPPSWLLPPDFPPNSSHFSALDKAGLISGLLNPRSGPVASCPGFLYDKPVSAVNNSVIDEECTGICSSSTGRDEDGSSFVSLCNVDDTEDQLGIVPVSHDEINARTLSGVPMSPEKQSCTKSCGTQPKQEHSLVPMQRSKSRQKALETRSGKTSGKSRFGINNSVDGRSPSKSCQGDEQVCGRAESPILVRSFSLSTEIGHEKASGCCLTQYPNNEVKEVHTEENQKDKDSSFRVGRIAISSAKCRQSKDVSSVSKALGYGSQLDGSTELVESDQAFALPSEICSSEEGIRSSSIEKIDDAPDIFLSKNLMMNDNAGGPSANKSCQDNEEVDDLRDSIELVKPFSASTEICFNEEVPSKLRSPDSPDGSLTQSANTEANEAHVADNQDTEKRDSVYTSRLTRPSGFYPQSAGVSSGSNKLDYFEQLDGSGGFPESHKASALPTGIFSWEGAVTCSTERISDPGNVLVSGDSGINNNVSVPPGDNNSQVVEQLERLRESLKLVKSFSFPTKTCDKQEASIRVTRSSNRCQLFKDAPSTSKTHSSFEQFDGSRDYYGLHKYSASTTEICSSKEADIRPCLTNDTFDAIETSLTKSAQCKAQDGKTRDEGEEAKGHSFTTGRITTCTSETGDAVDASLTKSEECTSQDEQMSDDEDEATVHSFTAARMNTSTSGRQSSPCIPSSSIASGHEQKISGIRESLIKSAECKAKDGETRDDRESIRESLIKSAECKAKDGELRDDGEETGSDSFAAGRLTTSTSGRQSSPSLPSSSKASGHGEKVIDIRESLEFVDQTASAMGNFSTEEAETGNRKPQMQHQEESGRNAMIAMTCGHKRISAFSFSSDGQKLTLEPSDCYSKHIQVETDPDTSELSGASVIGGTVNGQDVSDNSSFDPLVSGTKANHCERSPQAGKKLKYSIVSPVIEYMDVNEADQAMPEFERFGAQHFGEEFLFEDLSILNNMKEHTSVHEHTSTSTCFSAPMSPFPAACKSSFPPRLSKNNDMRRSLLEQQCRSACLSTPSSPFPSARNLEPHIYSSVPNGLLENVDPRSSLVPVGSVSQRKCHSDLFLYPQYLCGLDIKKPFLSPVENGFESIASKSAGSGKVTSGNPELTCFTIMEDPESSEEDGNEPKAGLEATDLSTESSIKEPLCDISVKNTTSLVQNEAVEKQSLESVSTENGISETCDMDNQANGMSNRPSRLITRGKENKGFSVGGNSIKKNKSKPHSSKFSKRKSSEKSSLRTRGQSLSENEQKHNNIVSNLKSFIPLVQRKKDAAKAPVKREVKVKALEAAEANKRLAEEKENERKQKKEALKLERARLEQEKFKQIELANKLKEEAKKKRDAENAAKKRQRAEEEKIEKERKRQRVEDARCQQKQAQEKLHAWKEESRYGTVDERTFDGKELNKKEQKEFDRTTEASTSSNQLQELVDAGTVKTKAGDGIPAVDSVVTAESSTPYKKPISRTSEEQSYDISPYQCSDDEEEEDEEVPNTKFIPSWASKSCVSLALSSLHQLDPDTIFPPRSFCNLDEVLVPKRLPVDPNKR
ncbi:uncharacterized protein LOC141656939 [Silene latifolia]|uniref:uncharacterized protein LOC141656939 n=1 Tax=Silene latifolia TaxID=37657 RepID=UPI003D77C97F